MKRHTIFGLTAAASLIGLVCAQTAEKMNDRLPMQFDPLAGSGTLIGLVPEQTPVRSPEKKSSFDAVLVDAAQKMNARLPMQLDKETRLDTTLAGPGNKMTYFYTLIHLVVEDGDGEAVTKAMRPRILNGYKTDPQFKIFREHHTEMHLTYRDKNGKHVTTIIVSPDDRQ
jgi:hypothetical protein